MSSIGLSKRFIVLAYVGWPSCYIFIIAGYFNLDWTSVEETIALKEGISVNININLMIIKGLHSHPRV